MIGNYKQNMKNNQENIKNMDICEENMEDIEKKVEIMEIILRMKTWIGHKYTANVKL